MGPLKLRQALLAFDLLVSVNHHHLGSLLGICMHVNPKCLLQPAFARLTNAIQGIFLLLVESLINCFKVLKRLIRLSVALMLGTIIPRIMTSIWINIFVLIIF